MEFDLKDVKPSVLNWFLIGLMAMTFIIFAKYLVNQFDNPLTSYLKDFVTAV